VDIEDIDANAPTIVWDAEGNTDLRRLRLTSNLRVLDRLLRPSEGYRLFTAAELGGGPLGGDEDFYTFSVGFDFYAPIYTDLGERSHVLHFRQNFDYGSAFGDSNDLFLSERWYLGGGNLRGFEPRQAGPKQFDNPTGGEARYTASLEYEFPLMSTRIPGRFVDTEILRAVVFTDFGLLGLEIDDPTFRDPRWSVGFGVRIDLPVLGIPIALDFGWPLVYQETDDRQVVFFSLRR
jgi:outer membrane protein insertion porin family